MGRKFAFDWGQSLEVNLYLRQLARDLFDSEHEVHLIPACGEHPTDEVYALWMNAIGVPFTGIHRCIVREGEPNYNAGLKVSKMKELGCHVLYDDSDANLVAVREAGLEGVKINGNHPVPIPLELTKIEVCENIVSLFVF